jgi:hypothetical protein
MISPGSTVIPPSRIGPFHSEFVVDSHRGLEVA